MTYFVLTANALQVFTKSGQASVPFSQEVIKFQEIIDRKTFEAQIKDFFLKTKGGEAVFFLGEDITYAKTLNRTADAELILEAKDFFEKIPFQQEFLAKKIVRLKKQVVLLATHRDYYQTIVHIAQAHGWQIKYIISLALFSSLLAGKQISFPLLSSFARNRLLLEEADFFQEYVPQEENDATPEAEGVIPEELVEARKTVKFSMKAQYLVAVVCLMCFAGALYYAYPLLFPPPPKKAPVAALPTIVPTLQISPIPVASVSAKLNKADLRIDVLNGSGIAGQATVIKDSLVSAGFPSVDTGNAEQSFAVSQVVFGPAVSVQFKADIMQALKESLATINTISTTTAELYDVVITTGNSAQ